MPAGLLPGDPRRVMPMVAVRMIPVCVLVLYAEILR